GPGAGSCLGAAPGAGGSPPGPRGERRHPAWDAVGGTDTPAASRGCGNGCACRSRHRRGARIGHDGASRVGGLVPAPATVEVRRCRVQDGVVDAGRWAGPAAQVVLLLASRFGCNAAPGPRKDRGYRYSRAHKAMSAVPHRTAQDAQFEEVLVALKTREACVGVIGLGYVGLPLVRLFWQAGFRVTGF